MYWAVRCRVHHLAAKPWNRFARSKEGESNQKRVIITKFLNSLQDLELQTNGAIGEQEELDLESYRHDMVRAKANNRRVVIEESKAITEDERAFIVKAKAMEKGDVLRENAKGVFVLDTTKREGAPKREGTTKRGTEDIPMVAGMVRTLALSNVVKLERKAVAGATTTVKNNAAAANQQWEKKVAEAEAAVAAAVVKREEGLALAKSLLHKENQSVSSNFDSIHCCDGNWGAANNRGNIGPLALYKVLAARIDRVRDIVQVVAVNQPGLIKKIQVMKLAFLENLEKLDRGADNSGIFHEVNTPWGIPMAVGFNLGEL